MKDKIAVIFSDLDDQVKVAEELALLLEQLYLHYENDPQKLESFAYGLLMYSYIIYNGLFGKQGGQHESY